MLYRDLRIDPEITKLLKLRSLKIVTGSSQSSFDTNLAEGLFSPAKPFNLSEYSAGISASFTSEAPNSIFEEELILLKVPSIVLNLELALGGMGFELWILLFEMEDY